MRKSKDGSPVPKNKALLFIREFCVKMAGKSIFKVEFNSIQYVIQPFCKELMKEYRAKGLSGLLDAINTGEPETGNEYHEYRKNDLIDQSETQ